MAKVNDPSYDPALQMFIEKPRPLNVNTLIFIRALVDSNRLGRNRGPAGPPSGQIFDAMAEPELLALFNARNLLIDTRPARSTELADKSTPPRPLD